MSGVRRAEARRTGKKHREAERISEDGERGCCVAETREDWTSWGSMRGCPGRVFRGLGGAEGNGEAEGAVGWAQTQRNARAELGSGVAHWSEGEGVWPGVEGRRMNKAKGTAAETTKECGWGGYWGPGPGGAGVGDNQGGAG